MYSCYVWKEVIPLLPQFGDNQNLPNLFWLDASWDYPSNKLRMILVTALLLSNITLGNRSDVLIWTVVLTRMVNFTICNFFSSFCTLSIEYPEFFNPVLCRFWYGGLFRNISILMVLYLQRTQSPLILYAFYM